MGLEKNFQESVLQYLNNLPGCKAENESGNASQSGRPDITGCYKGFMFKLELKTPDHKYQASKKQLIELRKWKNVGCTVGVIYDMDTLKELFKWNWNGPAFRYTHELPNGCTSWFDIPGTNKWK